MVTTRVRSASAPRRESERVYLELRELLVQGRIRPGEAIEEGRLLKELSVGRTPLREAILRLATEGLIEILPRRGTFATDIVFSDVQDLLEMRYHLEGLCARLAAERITGDELSRMERILGGAGSLATNTAELVRVDREFHRALIEATRNRFLVETFWRLYNLSLRLMYVTRSRICEFPDVVEQYLAVLDALKRKDADAAERAVLEHLADFRERLRQSL